MFCLRKEKSMEYYAKSGKKILSQGEIDKVRNELENLIINLENEFTETDLKVIKNNIAHLQDTKEEEQKTLKEHQDDIVKCAEMFFFRIWRIFYRKRKMSGYRGMQNTRLGKSKPDFSRFGKFEFD